MAPHLWLLTTALALSADPVSADLQRISGLPHASRAVVVDDLPLLHTGQLLPIEGDKVVTMGDPAGQLTHLLDRLDLALKAGGSGPDRLVRLHLYASDQVAADAAYKVLIARFPAERRPAVTLMVGTPVRPGVQISLDAVAVTTLTDAKKAVQFPRSAAKVAAGASLAVLPPGPVYYVSGQAESGKSLAEATRKTLESLRATLRFLGRDREQVVQLKAFLHPMDKLPEVQKEFAAHFGDRPLPPVIFVEWTSPNSIEIELIATAPATTDKSPSAIDYLTPPDMKASPVYSRVARINQGRRIYTSSLVGEGGDASAQVKDVFVQLANILNRTRGDFRHLAKATYYVSRNDTSGPLNVLRPLYYDARRPPAASKAPVRGVGQADSGLAIDLIAVCVPPVD